MKNSFLASLSFYIIITLILVIICKYSAAQHIQYRHKLNPVPAAKADPAPVNTTPVVITEDTIKTMAIRRTASSMNPRPKKKYIEEQNMCNLSSLPELTPQLPVIINNVAPKMIIELKKRYMGRLYSITKLNMIDDRLKYKLKICDNDNGKFRSEYLDNAGNVVNDPDLDYD